VKTLFIEMLHDGGARVHVNPEAPEVSWLKQPDLTAVKDVSPSFWKLEGAKIVPMTSDEKTATIILRHEPAHAAPKPLPKPSRWLREAAWYLAGAITSGGALYLWGAF
jgi:hypothetical protein